MKVKAILIIELIVLLFLNSCRYNDCTDEYLFTSALEGTWILGELSVNGFDHTDEWKDFTLQFNFDHTYETQNSADLVIWPQSGTYQISSCKGDLIVIRNDGQFIKLGLVGVQSLDFKLYQSEKKLAWFFHLVK